jgi:RNase P subunit RPR2
MFDRKEWEAKNQEKLAVYREKAKRRYVEEVEEISKRSRVRYLKHREERQMHCLAYYYSCQECKYEYVAKQFRRLINLFE